MSDPSNNHVALECVSERGRPASLITVGPAGPQSRLEVVVRPVPAYQAAVLTTWALLVCAVAFAARPTIAAWPWTWRAGLDGVVTITTGLVVACAAGWVWRRVVESVIVDGAEAVHDLHQSNLEDLDEVSEPAAGVRM